MYRLGAAVIPSLPLSTSYALAAVAGALAARIAPQQRRAVISNLQHVIGTDAGPALVSKLATSVFQTVARYYVDLLDTPALDVQELRRHRVRTEGYDFLQQALAAQQGVILATIHYGCPEVALQAARAWGLRFFVLTEPLDPPQLSSLFTRLRASHGHQFMSVGMEGLKEAVRTLRKGGAVLLVVDRAIQGHGAVVPFFGLPAFMPTGAADLAARTHASLIPVVSRRMQDGTTIVTMQPPLILVKSSDRVADASQNTGALMQRFESVIRSDPGQWLVLESLWKPQRPSVV